MQVQHDDGFLLDAGRLLQDSSTTYTSLNKQECFVDP